MAIRATVEKIPTIDTAHVAAVVVRPMCPVPNTTRYLTGNVVIITNVKNNDNSIESNHQSII